MDTTKKHIVIELKAIYGKMKAYPICNDAKVFASIAGTKTLTRDTLRSIANLGYAISVDVNCYHNRTYSFPESKDICTEYGIDN